VLRALANLQDHFDATIKRVEQQANNTSAAVNSLQEEITELRREINTQNNQSNARIVLPIELSQQVRDAYQSLKENTPWGLESEDSFNNAQNNKVTSTLIQILKDKDEKLFDRYTAGLVRRACRRYFESLKRQEKESGLDNADEIKRKKRIVNRRHRVFKARNDNVPADLQEMWKKMTPECMTDQESDGETKVYKRPSFRSDELTNAIVRIDATRGVVRSYGEETDRLPSEKIDQNCLKNMNFE